MIRIAQLLIASMLIVPVSALADTITFSGAINQSTQDGTGPATNNPGLNNVSDGDAYILSLSFAGSISAPGTYNLLGSTLVFGDAAAGATANAFDSVSLTITQNGIIDDFSMLACLTTGSACNQGNQLDLNFSIPSTGLNGQNVKAQSLPGLQPFELLEDDGVTDLQGSVTAYSNSSPNSPVPEPGSLLLLASGLGAVAFQRFRRFGK